MPASIQRPVSHVLLPVLLVAVLLFAAVAPGVVSAAPSTWTGGGGSGLWGTSSNVGTVAIGALSFTNSGTLAANQNAAMSGGGGLTFDNVGSGTTHAYLSESNSYTGGTGMGGSSLVGSFGAASQTAEVRGGVTLAGDASQP
jgi:hypothetical protein